MWFHLMYVFPSIFVIGGTKEKFEVCLSKNGGNLSLLLKVAAGQRTGGKHFTSPSGML